MTIASKEDASQRASFRNCRLEVTGKIATVRQDGRNTVALQFTFATTGSVTIRVRVSGLETVIGQYAAHPRQRPPTSMSLREIAENGRANALAVLTSKPGDTVRVKSIAIPSCRYGDNIRTLEIRALPDQAAITKIPADPAKP